MNIETMTIDELKEEVQLQKEIAEQWKKNYIRSKAKLASNGEG